MSKKIYIFSCTRKITKHLIFTLICCRLTLIYFPYFCIVLTIRSVIMKSIYTALTTKMVAEYIVLFNKISVVSDKILRIYIYIQELLLILKKFPLHTLSTYNSFVINCDTLICTLILCCVCCDSTLILFFDHKLYGNLSTLNLLVKKW